MVAYTTSEQDPKPASTARVDRGISDHKDMVRSVMRLGVITKRPDQGGQDVQEESRRHPTVP